MKPHLAVEAWYLIRASTASRAARTRIRGAAAVGARVATADLYLFLPAPSKPPFVPCSYFAWPSNSLCLPLVMRSDTYLTTLLDERSPAHLVLYRLLFGLDYSLHLRIPATQAFSYGFRVYYRILLLLLYFFRR